MPWRENFYSRMVAWMKVLLPLAALGILSSLFLVSRSIIPDATIPFSTIDINERAREEQVTAPEFSGMTDEGHLIAFQAATARPDPDHGARALAEDLRARIDLTSGTVITFRSGGGLVDEPGDRAELDGDVVVESSQGYTVHTDRLISGMHEIRAETPGPIEGQGPPGHFTAGKMLLTDEGADGTRDIHLLFTDGVKLIYDPREIKD